MSSSNSIQFPYQVILVIVEYVCVDGGFMLLLFFFLPFNFIINFVLFVRNLASFVLFMGWMEKFLRGYESNN